MASWTGRCGKTRRRPRAADRVDLGLLAEVAHRTSSAVILTDAQRRITWVNAAFERMTGWSAVEARGRSPGELLQFDGTDLATIERMRVALDAGEAFRGELLNQARNGRRYWIDIEIQPLHDAVGRRTGFMALQVDSTERRNADAALRASQAFLYNIGRIGGVAGWACDLRSGTVHWTDQTCRILDVEPGHRPTLQECLDHCAPEARDEVLREIERGFAAGCVWDLELPIVTASGRRRWVRAVAEGAYADGGLVRIVGALQDITARRDMELQLQRSAELLRGALDVLDEAFVLYGPDDRLVFCNDKFRALYALSADLIVPGARFEDILRQGAERGQYAAAVGRVEDWVAERLAAHRSGESVQIQRLGDGRVLRIAERRMPDGHTVGFRIDITDLVRATEAAERAHRAQTEFIATISHELRTPLQSIIGFSELGQVFASGQPPLRGMFDDIHAGGQRMLRLVNGLLDVFKLDGSVGSLALCRCDLMPLVIEVIRELEPIAATRQVALAPPVAGAPLWVDADAFRLQQVLRNVLANALRFAPVGSVVEIGCGVDSDEVLVSIRDHGPGIPTDELETIFDAFVQSSRTRDGSGGTGLGLTICRKIMSAHGGRITAANAPQGGASITLGLPAAVPRGAEMSRSPSSCQAAW